MGGVFAVLLQRKTEHELVLSGDLAALEASLKEEKDKLISINNGTKEDLMSLPGIGESKANNIIKYRLNITFTA